jgi:anti-anti-sigma regulatory factor
MLRVETQDSANTLIVRLEGRFTGDGAEQVRTLVTRCNIEGGLVVDLTDVTFIDSVGEATRGRKDTRVPAFGRLPA